MTCKSCQFRCIFNMDCLTCQAKHLLMIQPEAATAWLDNLEAAQGPNARHAVRAEAKRLKSLRASMEAGDAR